MTMHTQTPSIAIPGSPRTPSRLVVAGFAVAALAVAAVAGLWQAGRDGGTSETATAPVAVERPVVTRAGDSTITYYLVDSPAEASAIQAGLAEADAIRAQLGEPSLRDRVVVAGTHEAETLLRALGEMSPEGVRFVDLHSDADASAPTGWPADALSREMEAIASEAAGVHAAR